MTKLGTCTLILAKEKLKNIVLGLEDRGETLIFISRHFDETMNILILHFLRFGTLNCFSDCFVTRINK